MAEPDETELKSFAAKAGLSRQFTFKEFKIFEAISALLAANSGFSLNFVFKGGTALNKAYFAGSQRFSEDIDFDLFSGGPRAKKISSLTSLSHSMKGFFVQGPWIRKDTVRFSLGYSFFGSPDHVRLEFSIGKLPLTLHPMASADLTSDITGVRFYRVPCYSLDDMVARKFNALRTRGEGKDVWDCFHGIPKTKELKKAIRIAMKSEGVSLTVEEAIAQAIKKLEKADPERMMKASNPYIPLRLRPKDWKEAVMGVIRELELL
ncbi:nucleotidyl transferase AbiEii/AbiGii toxin family protein [Candidatus Micrarchaeota archaeon]|nr:nucleotidyl transferase AbiEii/AbiGii toxin family protein [Candidatus Micrarchaeota archaeon]